MEQFLLVVVDDDKKVFSVEGPMTNDTSWNENICSAQKSGRNVRCFSSKSNKASIITEMENSYKLEHVASGTII